MQMKIQGMPPTRDSDKWRKQSGILDSCMVVQSSNQLFPETFASDCMDLNKYGFTHYFAGPLPLTLQWEG